MNVTADSSRSVRNAVVIVPGTAIVDPLQLIDAHRPAGDDHRPVAIAHAAAARQQGVLVEQVGIGVNADGRHLQFAAQAPGD